MTLYSRIKNQFEYLGLPDWLNQMFIFLLSVIVIFYSGEFDNWHFILLINFLMSLSIILIINRYEKKSQDGLKTLPLLRFIRYWYPVIFILFFFKEIYWIMFYLKTNYYDHLLIEADRWIFSVNPTQYLMKYSSPLLTEILQIIYSLFYLMPVIYGLELYLWKRYREFKYAMFVIFFGFYLSFLIYMILPAIGPRFTLHNFQEQNTELPGLLFTDILRDVINFGESIPSDIPNPESHAQRDAFPSGHTIIILLITFLSCKLKSNSRFFYIPYSVLMIFSTIYLQYHYVVDIIAGIMITIFTILVTNIFYKEKYFHTDSISKT